MGFPTGGFSTIQEFDKRIEVLKSLGCPIIELSLHTIDRLQVAFDNIDHVVKAVAGFTAVSIHAPNHGVRYDSSTHAQQVIEQLKSLARALHPRVVVVHPDLIDEPAVLQGIDWTLGIENMDWRKTTAQFPDQLTPWFEHYPKATMVLDMNHCYTNDRSMVLAGALWEKFSDRMHSIHLSAFGGAERPHMPFHTSSCDDIIKALPTLDVAIILEVGVGQLSPQEVATEYAYVLSKIRLYHHLDTVLG